MKSKDEIEHLKETLEAITPLLKDDRQKMGFDSFISALDWVLEAEVNT